ncbi:hypothetical protein GALMADRAFT_143519 [Galerina marginata CBS 339.88]|uniref:Uncharacterized protein n=1 Tax=Galerina marginata (strain CBS 339.88) TaxID=685588 RepID=A0A067SVI8_GALM3|nr:hypothetical protein GALMADRAFT_143519 [Galerina marginata CBS 339.88]
MAKRGAGEAAGIAGEGGIEKAGGFGIQYSEAEGVDSEGCNVVRFYCSVIVLATLSAPFSSIPSQLTLTQVPDIRRADTNDTGIDRKMHVSTALSLPVPRALSHQSSQRLISHCLIQR